MKCCSFSFASLLPGVGVRCYAFVFGNWKIVLACMYVCMESNAPLVIHCSLSISPSASVFEGGSYGHIIGFPVGTLVDYWIKAQLIKKSQC